MPRSPRNPARHERAPPPIAHSRGIAQAVLERGDAGPIGHAQASITRFDDALLQARIAREAVEHANEELHTQLARQQQAKKVAEGAERRAWDQAARERSLRLAAERDRADALAQVTVITSQRELAETGARPGRKGTKSQARCRAQPRARPPAIQNGAGCQAPNCISKPEPILHPELVISKSHENTSGCERRSTAVTELRPGQGKTKDASR
jgi:hypothetical protein